MGRKEQDRKQKRVMGGKGSGGGWGGSYFGLILINLEHFKFSLMSFGLYLLVFSLFVN